MRSLILLVLCVFASSLLLAQNRLFYAGGAGEETLYDIVQLSDGTVLIAGAADDLDWLPAGLNRIELDPAGIANAQGGNRFAFLLHADSTLENLLDVVYLPQGGAEDFRFIKSTNLPRAATGDLYLSGGTEDAGPGGYFIGKLDNNFVDGLPTAFSWTYNAKCKNGDYPKNYQPWDVDAAGRVYFVRGDSHDFSWSAMYRLTGEGELDVVENWRTHWIASGGEFHGTPASSYSGSTLDYSAIVFKKDGRCNLRSWSQADYELIQPDENGGTKQGKWPFDVLYNGPCDPTADSPNTNGPGYTGYDNPDGSITYGPSSVTVDRRDGHIYLGINTKSVLPGGNPDFEPAVVAFDATGQLKWWSRLYHEIRPDGTTHNSTPDQYIDGLAIDYGSGGPGQLIVNARTHGNNVENFWEGNTIAANPAAKGFQQQFTGTSGNIHISWLGKLDLADGTLRRATYVAEFADNPSGLGAALSDPLMDNWPNPNAGWPTVNTTRLRQNTVKVTADGSVIIIGTGRRTMTTANAYQKMPRPGEGQSSWNYFVRQYAPDLSKPLYSSLVTGTWNPQGGPQADNTELHNFFKLRGGIAVVGSHDGEGSEVAVTGVPGWGSSTYQGRSALIGYFSAPEITDAADSPVVQMVAVRDGSGEPLLSPSIFPNPTVGRVTIDPTFPVSSVRVLDRLGRNVRVSEGQNVDLSGLPAGVYGLRGRLV
ncbi:MAG: hypothetical protein WBA17_16905, partial [Saprospiraceae bacterium]